METIGPPQVLALICDKSQFFVKFRLCEGPPGEGSVCRDYRRSFMRLPPLDSPARSCGPNAVLMQNRNETAVGTPSGSFHVCSKGTTLWSETTEEADAPPLKTA